MSTGSGYQFGYQKPPLGIGVAELRPKSPGQTGGGDRDRTGYLLHAMQALYQLSYAPESNLRA